MAATVYGDAGAAKLAGADFTGFVAPAVVTLTDAATITVNASLGNVFRVTLAGNRTLAAPSSPADGQAIRFEVTQDATGHRTLAFASAYEFSSLLPAPALSTGAAVTDLLIFAYNAPRTKWLFCGFVPGFA
jgi:hypothetical protein